MNTTKSRLAAIRRRDAEFDGKFVYGVVTTGVYCRPSCPSRHAKPENVRLFEDNASARLAGFRACKRCAPEAALPDYIVDLADAIVREPESRIVLHGYADRSKLSEATVRRRFKTHFGLTPKQFQSALRTQTLKVALRDKSTITEAIHAAGYPSSARVYESLETSLGMTPGQYRSGGAGEQIVYAMRRTRMGLLGLGATTRGVCFVEFGESREAILARLVAEFPAASMEASCAVNSPQLDAWLDALETHVTRGEAAHNIPLDLSGTAFQIRVWRFLTGLSSGDRVTYKDVASGIGKPKAIRAAASACASNRIALLVPCHRVLRSDGGLGGYKWGIERKRDLLKLESAESGH